MTWRRRSNPLDQIVYGVCWASDLAEFLAVGLDGGSTEALIRSVDGTSWIYQASPFDGTTPRAAVRDLFHGVSVVAGRTADAADAFITSPDDIVWTGRGNPFVSDGFGLGAAVRESDGALFIAGASGRGSLGFSLDDGSTWTQLPLPPDIFSGVRAVSVRAADDLILIAGTPYDLYYFPANDYAAVSTDSGATWLTTRPFGDGGSCYGSAVRNSDGALVVVGDDASGFGAVAVSTDNGATWTTYSPFGVIGGSHLYGVAVRQSDDALIVAGTDNGGLHQFAVSTDGGTTWTPGVPFGVGGFAQSVAIRPSDDAILIVGTDSGSSVQFAVSTDSGLTWTTSAVALIGVGNGVAVRSSDDLILVAGTGDDHAATSADGGATWVATSPFGALGYGGGTAIRQSDGALLVAGTDPTGALQSAVSTDDGSSWVIGSPLSVPRGTALCVSCKQSNGALIAGADSASIRPLAVSGDGGATWTAVPSPFDGGGEVHAVDYAVSDDTWFASGLDSSGTPLVAASIDDGVSWASLGVQPPMAFNGFYWPIVYRDEANGAWWVIGQTTGNHAAAVSADGGASWTEVTTPLDDPALTGGAMAMVNAGGPLALAGTDSTNTKQMCVSVDNGATWAFDGTPSPFGASNLAYTLAYSPDLDVAVAGGYGIGTIASGLPSLPVPPPDPTLFWTPRSSPFNGGGQGNGGCWGDDRLEFLVVGTNGTYAILKSLNGITWMPMTTPFDGGGVGYGVVRDVFHSLYIAVGISVDAADAIITSPDGDTWTGHGNPFIAGGRGAAAAIRPSDDAILVAGANDGYAAIKQLAISTDDAASWTDIPLDTGVVTGQALDVAVRAADDLILLVGDFNLGPVAISTDAGATWSFPGMGGFYTGRHCVIRDSDGALIVSDSNGQVAISTDDGATWGFHHPFAGFSAAANILNGIAVRQSDGAIIAVGWTATAGPANNAYAISTDSGATWTTHRPYGSALGTELLCVAVRTSDDAIAVGGTGGGGLGQLTISTDDGATWSSYDPPQVPISVRVRDSDDLIVVTSVAPNGVAVSADGGSTWTSSNPFPVGYGNGCAVRASDGALIAVGHDNTGTVQIALSTDDGATWGATDPTVFTAAAGLPNCIACKQSNGATIVGASSLPQVVATSADGITYALVSSPFDEGQLLGIGYSESEDLWIAAGIDASFNALVASSADDGATWTVISTHPMLYDGNGPRVYRDEANGRWWLFCRTIGGESAAFSEDAGATWTEVSTPFDTSFALAYGAVAAPIGPLVLVGNGAGGAAIAESLDHGDVWTADTSPFDDLGTAYAVFASPDLIVAVGTTGDSSVAIATGSTSPPTPPPPATGQIALSVDDTVVVVDAATLTIVATVAVSSAPQGLAFSHDGRLIAVACSTGGTVDVIETTGYTVAQSIPVGSVPWSVAFTPDDSQIAVIHQSSDGLFVIDTTLWAVTNMLALGSQPTDLAFSPSGDRLAVTDRIDNSLTIIETTGWTITDTVGTGTAPVGVVWSPDDSFVAVANQDDGAITAYTPTDFSVIATTSVGSNPTYLEVSDDAVTVVVLNASDSTLSIIETTGWSVTSTATVTATLEDLTYTPEGLNIALAASEGPTGEVRIVTTETWAETDEAAIGDVPNRIAASLPAEAPPTSEPIPKALKNTWRWVICGLDGATKSFLDKIATNVQIAYILDDAAMMTCDVPSDHFEVYQQTNPDHLGHRYPRVNYGNRVIYGLRREEPGHGKPPWVCRFAGVIDILQDQATEDDPITHLTAYDPWMWARSLPVLNVDGSLLGPNGLTYEGKTADYIAKDLIANAYAWIVATFPDPMPWTEIGDGLHLPNDGEHNYIDITTGHFDTAAVIDSINFAQGISVGEAWAQLCQTGTIDIVLSPVFGPAIGKPGVLCVMNVYAQAGKERPNAVFGWDLFPRNLVGVDHLFDGTQIENIGQFYAGNDAVPVAQDDHSVGTYGPYYVQKNYPAGSNSAAVQLLALAEIALRKRGKKTLQIEPTPGLAPDPFTAYSLGDVVPVWAGRPMPPPPPLTGNAAGNALRNGIRSYTLGTNRVYGFAIDLSDDLQETVSGLLLSNPDETI